MNECLDEQRDDRIAAVLFVDVLEQICCLVDCYTLDDCRLALSARCRRVAPQCALGALSFFVVLLLRNSASRHLLARVLEVTLSEIMSVETRICTLGIRKSTPTRKAKLLWMTSHYAPTVVRSVAEIPFHVFI